ncbi:AMP-binding protein [Mycolicibacterium neoaurum]|uniref:AMP-binding protein n=1 Tax=Mycolicibacterium neoaurum TaxID=1795 RepID=UPI0026738F2C|nr:AMP-binding protein [Mycolicibacterium neoaurum]MDO3401698.1 AMP-binding protein [Mycolicibacterium neoaurum]
MLYHILRVGHLRGVTQARKEASVIADRTLSYELGSQSPALLECTIGVNLAEAAAAYAENDALVDVGTDRRWSYREFLLATRRVASGLLAMGISPGDRVGIWSPNTAEWTIVQYATAEVGAILVTINPAYREHELEFVLNQAQVRMVITAEAFKTSNYRAMLEAARPRCSYLEHIVVVGDPHWNELSSSAIDDEGLCAAAAELTPDDPINIQYTSGTTGSPKGATLTHRNILNNGYFVGELLGYNSSDRICIPVPFYHCFGMVMGNLAATSHGSTMVIPGPGFDPAATLSAVAAERCTSLYGVPTMFIAELALPVFDDFDLTSLRTGIMAGSPCPAEVMRQVIDRMHMTDISICYGMTETSPVSTQTRSDDSFVQRINTVGRAGPHLEVKIVAPGSAITVARGVQGELCTRGYSVMAGYWNQPEMTAAVIDDQGWMHTGDLGVMDDDGYVSITGRIKDMVIRGGENIYPREIEEFLYTHPAILDAQVIGVPDEHYGEELMVWVRMKDGATPLSADELRQYCTGKLAHYKIPRYVRIVDDFPMTVTGKVRKVEMREQATQMLADHTAVGTSEGSRS